MSKKKGGRDLPVKQMDEFWDLNSDCALRDLSFRGFLFTWCNYKEGEERIFECLDRFFTDSRWCELFPEVMVTHGLTTYFDHSPLWLDTTKIFLV